MLRSQDEHSEDIAALVLQISEITSFASTTQLRQPQKIHTKNSSLPLRYFSIQ